MLKPTVSILLIYVFVSNVGVANTCDQLAQESAELTLSAEEIAAIESYLDSSEAINQFLRGQKRGTTELKRVVSVLERALRKLPPRKGTFFRSLGVSNVEPGIASTIDAERKWGWLREAIEKGRLSDPAFVSMTEFKSGRGDQAHIQVLMEIVSKTSRNIRKFNPKEKEHILLPNTELEVLSSRISFRKDSGLKAVIEAAGKKFPSFEVQDGEIVYTGRWGYGDTMAPGAKGVMNAMLLGYELQNYFPNVTPEIILKNARRYKFPFVNLRLREL